MDYYDLMIRRSRQAPAPTPPSPSSDLVFYMPFTDSVTADIAGGRTMTTTGSPVLTTIDGVPCASIGNNNKLFTDTLAGTNGNLPTGNASWSVMCFAYFPSLSWANNFFALGQASGRLCILQGPKGGHPIYNNYGPDHEPGTPDWTTGVWHHTAATYDGSTMTLKGYFDGSPNGTWSVASQGLNITVGGSGGVHMGEFGGYWCPECYIASARIYNRVLSDDEIADLAGEFQPATSATAFSKAEPPTMSNSGSQASTHFAIEQGRLYFSATGFSSISGTATQVGTRTDWEAVTELSYRTNATDYGEVCALGIAGGRLMTVAADGTTTVRWSNKDCTLVSGYHIKYLAENSMEYFGLAVCSDGLYKVSRTTRWKISLKADWTAISGGICYYNGTYYNEAYGIDSQGVCYRIAYDGTLTQVETGMTACAGTYAGGSHLGNWGDVTALTGYTRSGVSSLFIRNGALYYDQNAGKIGSATGTLIDDTGTWTAIYGTRQSGTGIRDGKFCTISTGGYTATAFDADAVGDGCYAYNGLIYNASGNRVTSATYDN